MDRALVILSLAAVYMIPTMRRMVVDVDESALFDRTWRSTKTTKRRARRQPNAGALSQPTADLRRLAARRAAGGSGGRRRCLARWPHTGGVVARDARSAAQGLLRAREKIAMDYTATRATYETSRASIVARRWRVWTLGDELAALETAGIVRVVRSESFRGRPHAYLGQPPRWSSSSALT